MYIVARAVAQCIVATFFGDVRAVGLERIPVEGPVIFVGNHNNKFVDASVVMACVPRSLRFLIATVSLSVRVVGRLAKFAGAIGVSRPQDMKFVGMGRIMALVADGELDDLYDRATTASENNCGENGRETQSGETQSGENKSGENQSGENQSGETQPGETQSGETQSGETQSGGTQETPSREMQYTMYGNNQTRFRIDCKKHDRVLLDGTMFSVVEVRNDHELIVTSRDVVVSSALLKNSAGTFVAAVSGDLIKEEVSGELGRVGATFTVFPKVDQGDVYESVSQALYEGSSICVFPEGGSHDRPELLPLKPGVAIMALNSALMGVEDLLIIPLGIHYFDRHKFGSRTIVQVGQPIPIREELMRMYSGQGSKREAIRLLMEDVKDGMEDCLVYANSYDKLKVISLCSSLYLPDHLAVQAEKRHRLQTIFTQLVNAADILAQAEAVSGLEGSFNLKELEDTVQAYDHLLEANGLNDVDVTSMHLNAENAAFKLVQLLIPILLLSVVVVPAIMATAPLKYIFRLMTEKHRSEALAKSNVKLTAVDVIASYKIVWWICFMPIVFILIGSICSTWVVVNRELLFTTGSRFLRMDLPRLWIFTFSLLLLTQPIATYLGLTFQNKLIPYLKQMRCYYQVLISELDVWRGGEREVIIDRIDVQLKVREYVKHILSIKHFLQANNKRAKKLQDTLNDLEKLIPLVIIDNDTRRLTRQKRKIMPVVYRSAVMSREEIL
ncbi:putative glycerol-3-phosphate acyltransferase [Gregarina niphandrodes]|uniref:Glycerol-3-phosphate acyltransferase n=1 Tax=Gregarina niphandrodes TaxID=110365 RepID=A0A023B8U7_GRENI|nr:putative glycerol-3-phosphate acyltransferase [Gregarina niphandrodes]EZG70493.1 putative glycerol-3-phosphate acyltransferase [Gregarina niphandrodes]|eukprot:XP_011129944.1 putative glycerol-3-phosphate acyltransferase [Gregarina niphandrodes]